MRRFYFISGVLLLSSGPAYALPSMMDMGAAPTPPTYEPSRAGNVAIIRQSGSGGNVIHIQQAGDDNQAITTQNGENNDVNIIQSGQHNDMEVNQTGENNSYSRKQTGDSRAVINQNGEIETIYESGNQGSSGGN